jgi:hypothetical protein
MVIMPMIDSMSRKIRVALALVVVAAASLGASSASAGWLTNFLRGGDNSAEADAPDPSIFLKSGYCPPVEIRVGTESLVVYERGHDGDENYVRFQGSLSKTARECHIAGDTLTLKVGIVGRLIAGPKGGPGSFTVPVRVAVVKQHGATVLFSQMQKAPVSLSAPTYAADYTYVFDNISFKIAPDDRDLVIYVGYDEGKPKKPVPTG